MQLNALLMHPQAKLSRNGNLMNNDFCRPKTLSHLLKDESSAFKMPTIKLNIDGAFKTLTLTAIFFSNISERNI